MKKTVITSLTVESITEAVLAHGITHRGLGAVALGYDYTIEQFIVFSRQQEDTEGYTVVIPNVSIYLREDFTLHPSLFNAIASVSYKYRFLLGEFEREVEGLW